MLTGSLHVTTRQNVSAIESLFEKSRLNGHANMLKVVTGASNDEDCRLVHKVGSNLKSSFDSESNEHYIGICLGASGSLGRILNRKFTPVTHPLMATAAPGQLSAKELMEKRVELKLLQPKQFYLFGTPIQHSLSPAIHNAAYTTLLLPHKYSLLESDNIQYYVENILRNKEFGGASVTIPHKESIMPFLDEICGAAVNIGAVNTIAVTANDDDKSSGLPKLVGYNTDWIGIQRPILRRLRQRDPSKEWKSGLFASANIKADHQHKGIGLVIGAGGTAKAACYAVLDLGLKLYIVNRNADKGRHLAETFGGVFVDDLYAIASDALLDPKDIQVVISTVPLQANLTLPSVILECNKPVVLDAVYKPAITPLIAQAMQHNCLFVQGATMLLEQAIEQFQIWNKRRAPIDVMEQAVFSGVEKLN
jgi:pentafunctional AROM polypeptide